MSEHRKRAPGTAEEQPNFFWSLSGGIDSIAAFLTTKDAIETDRQGGNFAKKPVAIYLDTTVGVPLNRMYLEELCDTYSVQLWTLRTDESFLEWLGRDGAPGPAAHPNVKNELKGRQVSKLSTTQSDPAFILGLAADESEERAKMDKVEKKDTHIEIRPVHRLSRKERAKIILEHKECPINPLWCYPRAIKDCGCFANGDVSEVDRIKSLFPKFGRKLEMYEEAASFDGLKGNLGWGGLSAGEKRRVEKGEGISMCGAGCQRQEDPVIVRAFKTLAAGSNRQEAINILERPQDDSANTSSAGEW